MIAAVKTYLRGKLTAAGVPSARIADDPAQGEWPPPQTPYAEVVLEPERLERVNRLSAREYNAVTKQATEWKRLVRRTLPVRIRLVHQDEARLDALLTAFLAQLDAGFRDGSQTVTVAPEQAAWGGWQDKRPADREQVTVRITFTGAVYSSTAPGGTVQQVKVPTTNMV